MGFVLTIFVALTIFELALGNWLFKDEWYETHQLNIIRNRSLTYEVKNLKGFNESKITYTRDSNGLRGNCKVPNIDILSIGGSTTDQRYIDDKSTYQSLLQASLLDSGFELCISNAGVDGHSTFGHLLSFEKWFPLMKGLNPSYFFLYLGINDAAFRDQPKNGLDIIDLTEGNLFDKLKRDSALYKSISFAKDLLNKNFNFSNRHAYAGHKLEPSPIKSYTAVSISSLTKQLTDQNTARFHRRLERILHFITKEYNAIPICISQPHRLSISNHNVEKGLLDVFEYDGNSFNGLDFDYSLRSLNSDMKQLCTSSGGYFIDIYNKDFSDEDFYDDIHLNPIGTKKLTMHLLEELSDLKIFLKHGK